jgi:hypothetical protein
VFGGEMVCATLMRLPRLVIFKEAGEFQAGMLYAEKARRASLSITYITRLSQNFFEVIDKKLHHSGLPIFVIKKSVDKKTTLNI